MNSGYYSTVKNHLISYPPTVDVFAIYLNNVASSITAVTIKVASDVICVSIIF